jgi:uncharacterized membrane protein YedE/YeeE
VAAIGFRRTLARQRPLLAPRFDLPDRTRVDGRLLGGAALFGIGWGLVGFCPGPAFAALSTGTWGPIVFVVAMLAGMLVGRRLDGATAAVGPPADVRA